ncbi:uncharacterized protein [Dysidea avara]|uniref:uncharacterized protein n=1 Tax=Dysidea avara TaxID=196820 RepID=UPI0033201A13
MMYQLEKHWRNFGNMQYMEGKWRKADGKWRVITKPHCVQKDTVSCGVYVMKFAECIISQNPLPNTISNINDTRKSMAITLLDASEPLLNYCRACGMCDSTEDEENNWIRCDYCDWWFHLTCVNKSRKGRKS